MIIGVIYWAICVMIFWLICVVIFWLICGAICGELYSNFLDNILDALDTFLGYFNIANFRIKIALILFYLGDWCTIMFLNFLY